VKLPSDVFLLMREVRHNKMACWESVYKMSITDTSNSYFVSFHVRWAPCHHGMARPQVAGGGDDLQVWKVAANILNKQS
jgi:hypothetical protein